MKKLSIGAALALAFAAPSAFADEDKIRTRLTGYQEVPSVSTVAEGRLQVEIHSDGRAFDWVLSYSGLQGNVQQAHIHFAQKSVNGAIVVWLCGTGAPGTQFAGPTGTSTCPQSGTVSGTAMNANVFPGAAAQQLTAGEATAIEEVIAAMRAGVAYANVHTHLSPGGEIRGQIGGRGRGHAHRH
jgi:CHRD domain